MFGQQQNTDQKDTTAIPDQSIDGVLADQAPAVVAPAPTPTPITALAPAPNWQHPGLPLGSDNMPMDATSATTEASDNPNSSTSTPVVGEAIPTDLADIKQRALSQLAPLVSHLDQSPEERFRTTMMMIQASDDQNLVKDAYVAAQLIPDEKTRAQALLDIVNEINYFTQQHAE
jgi:hypothetical protein